MSLREQIRAVNRRKVAPLKIPEWGDLTVFVRTLSASESLTFLDQLEAAKDDKRMMLAVQMATFICEGDGTPAYDVAGALAELVDDGLQGPIKRIIESAMLESGLSAPEIVKGN